MSYPQFGYPYPGTACSIASSQLLVPGSSLQTTVPSSCGDVGRAAMADPSGVAGQGVYSSSLLSYPRMTGITEGIYTSAYAAQGYVPFGGDPSAFYAPLGTENTDGWRLSQTTTWPYDPNMAGYPYGSSYGGLDVRRKNATRESTSTLKAWLYEHIKNPYPTKGEKIMLAIITKMTLTQVSTWFANARRRLKKENKMQWSPRNRSGDDDDDKATSDDDGQNNGDNDGDGNSGGKLGDGGKKGDDEDVVVDTGNDNDSLLSLSEHSQDALGRLDGDTSAKPPGGSTYDLSKMDPSSALSRLASGPNSNAGGGHEQLTTGSPSSMMAHHQHLAGQRSMCDVGRSPTTQCGINRMNSLPIDSSRMASGLAGDSKPRIWSLADVAKSEGHSPIRRSLSNMNVVAGASNAQAQHPHTGQTPYSHPGYRSFQPWVNGAGAYATSAAGTSGSGLSYSGYSPSLTHHGLSSVGQMSGMTRNDMAATNNSGCVVAPTNYTSKLQNGLLDYDTEECM